MLLRFNQRVEAALERVLLTHPDAAVLVADGHASAGLVTDPSAIDGLRVTCVAGPLAVAVEETGYGRFSDPSPADAPTGARPIQWPVEMDLNDADRLKEQYGYTEPYATIRLWHPPGTHFPVYEFGGNPLAGDVIVDTGTQRVSERR
jgi:hypothetical protein